MIFRSNSNPALQIQIYYISKRQVNKKNQHYDNADIKYLTSRLLSQYGKAWRLIQDCVTSIQYNNFTKESVSGPICPILHPPEKYHGSMQVACEEQCVLFF